MRWWKRLSAWLRPDPKPVLIDDNLRAALVEVVSAELNGRDWFVWECEQWMDSRAPWFDPHRYRETEFAYPWPPQTSINRVFAISERRARARYGDAPVDQMGAWASAHYPAQRDIDSEYALSPDPVEHAMRDWRREQGTQH